MVTGGLCWESEALLGVWGRFHSWGPKEGGQEALYQEVTKETGFASLCPTPAFMAPPLPLTFLSPKQPDPLFWLLDLGPTLAQPDFPEIYFLCVHSVRPC